jgi:hypothetical protein
VKLVADKLIRAGSLSGLEPIDRHITHPDIPHDPFVDKSIHGPHRVFDVRSNVWKTMK